MSLQPIPDADLHAYVDGRLPVFRREQIESLASADPATAERIRCYGEQNRALKELFDPVLSEPLPESLRSLAEGPAKLPAPSAMPFLPRWSLQRMAASLAIAAVGGTIGWFAHDRVRAADTLATVTPLPRQAAIAHVVFSPDVKRPVEIGAEHEDQLVTWLSKRLGTAVHPPKLGALGFELIGGRLLPGNSGPVAQFMYHDATGQRLTLYVSTDNTANRDTAFRFAQEGPVNVFYWIDGKFGYALSAGINKSELARVATTVYDQLEKRQLPPPAERKSK